MKKETAQAAADINAALAPLSRRRFLKAALWATAGVAAGVAGGFALLRRSPLDALPVPAGLLHLSPAHYRLFDHLAQVLLPTTGALPLAAAIPVARNVDAILGALEPDVRKQLGIGLSLLDNAAVFSHGKRLVDLEPAAAQQFLSDWVNSSTLPKRALGLVASKLTHTGYWIDARTWPALGFDGPVSKKWGIPARGNQPMPV
jgi:hypothetical protein